MKKKTTIDYELFIQNAVRRAIHDLLVSVSKDGLPGKHYFYIDFLTTYPGVMISDALREEYPEDMIIALHDEYWDLDVQEDHFSVGLAFDHGEEKIVIPFSAILKFSDPSVDFGVEFSPPIFNASLDKIKNILLDDEDNKPTFIQEQGKSNIVSFDAFKKK
jgi:hypothetical protein